MYVCWECWRAEMKFKRAFFFAALGWLGSKNSSKMSSNSLIHKLFYMSAGVESQLWTNFTIEIYTSLVLAFLMCSESIFFSESDFKKNHIVDFWRLNVALAERVIYAAHFMCACHTYTHPTTPWCHISPNSSPCPTVHCAFNFTLAVYSAYTFCLIQSYDSNFD